MSDNKVIKLPSKDVWSAIKEVKNRDLHHLKITAGEDTSVVDIPIAFNFRIIPGVFTLPLQAVGLVTSIFARMTNTRISLFVNKDNDQ